MFTGLPLDRRTHAILICRMLADRAEDADVSLQTIGEIARELAAELLDGTSDDADGTRHPMATPRLRVIEGGRA